jgi:hypothetical protein
MEKTRPHHGFGLALADRSVGGVGRTDFIVGHPLLPFQG